MSVFNFIKVLGGIWTAVEIRVLEFTLLSKRGGFARGLCSGFSHILEGRQLGP